MAIKKSELYSSLWKSCDELRGGMDADKFKCDSSDLIWQVVSNGYDACTGTT